MCYLLPFLAKTGTTAWFVSETEAHGEIMNAVTDDLISVESTVASCENGIVQVKVSVRNKSEGDIPIQLQETHYNLLPGKTITKVIRKEFSKEMDEIQVPLIGFDFYIDETIEIPIGRYCDNDLGLGEDTSMESENWNNNTEGDTNSVHENEQVETE